MLSTPLVTKVLKSSGADRKWHPQGLDLPLVVQLLDALRVPPGGLILDPYAGGGTVAVACRHLGLRCLAGELDEERVRRTRHRLAHPELEAYPLTARGEETSDAVG
jgi:site-specific DNA-methyltransferase (adenine-specific)